MNTPSTRVPPAYPFPDADAAAQPHGSEDDIAVGGVGRVAEIAATARNHLADAAQIGRASCRERVYDDV